MRDEKLRAKSYSSPFLGLSSLSYSVREGKGTESTYGHSKSKSMAEMVKITFH